MLALLIFILYVIEKPVQSFGANFEKTTAGEYTVVNGLKYYSVGTSPELGLRMPNGVFQCMTSCTKLAECHSFYQDKGSCVFGLIQLVAGIQAENLTPINKNQKIFAKGKTYLK